MFLDHFSLREQPFGVTPDPAYLYLSRTHQSALDALSTGIRNDRGFMTVIAEPGMGKTTLLYHLVDQLRDSARTLFIFQTQCDSHEFFGHLLTELGMNPTGMDIPAMHERLNKTLFSEMLAGKRVVLVVDEAQNLAGPVLETIRLLSNFETPHAKLLQIIFAGQPQLATNLGSPALSQLRQRITVVAHLSPFRVDETSAYIQHRLRIAGYTGHGIFTTDAVAAIAVQSEGIPRVINNLCFNAMRIGSDRGLRLLDSRIVSQAAAQLRLEPVVAEAMSPQPTVCLASSGPSPRSASPISRRFAAPLSAPVRRVSKSWVYGTAALTLLIVAGVWGISGSLGQQVSVVPEAAETQLARPVQQTIEPTLDHVSDITPQMMTSLQFLLVSAQPNDTIKEISLRYLGRFDDEILKQMKVLNPELENFNEVAPGQLLRVPFPFGTLKKVFDSDSAGSSTRQRSAPLTVEVSRPLPSGGTVFDNTTVPPSQTLGAIRRPPLQASDPVPFVNTSNQLAGPAETPRSSLPSVSTLLPAGANGLSAAQNTLNSSSDRTAAPLAVDSSLAPATLKQTIKPAELISRREPTYPTIAKTNRISGSVEVHFKINIEGKVFDAAVVRGSPLLGSAVLQALQAWRYKPAYLNGTPIESEATMIFDFKGN